MTAWILGGGRMPSDRCLDMPMGRQTLYIIHLAYGMGPEVDTRRGLVPLRHHDLAWTSATPSRNGDPLILDWQLGRLTGGPPLGRRNYQPSILGLKAVPGRARSTDIRLTTALHPEAGW